MFQDIPLPGISKRNINLLIAILLLSCLYACGTGDSPTQELSALYTAGAQTVIFRLTESPIQDFLVPLMAQEITISPMGNQDFLPESANNLPTTTPPYGQTGTYADSPSAPQLFLSTPGPTDRPDRCQWVEQDPPDNSSLAANTGFITTWVLKNAGTSTWSQQYQAVWYNSSDSVRIGPDLPVAYRLSNDVGPDETYRFKVEMQAPLKPGKYYSLWGLQNNFGITFCTFDLTINVK